MRLQLSSSVSYFLCSALTLVLACMPARPPAPDPGREALLGTPPGPQAPTAVTAIDGTGGPPLPDATIVVRGARIAAVGPRAAVPIPAGARVITAAGKFVIPGLIATNYHMTLVGSATVADEDQLVAITAQGVELMLKYGITTVRSSMGYLPVYQQVQAALAAGRIEGARLLVGGNIVGWGGPFSETMGIRNRPPDWQYWNALMTQGTGEELHDLDTAALRVAIDAYLDKGPDFIKYGATAHGRGPLLFSPEQQAVLVKATHRRGKLIETHASSIEAKRAAVLAGVDIIQHPENRGLDDALVRLLVERGVICSINFRKRESSQKRDAEIQRLIQGGCTISVAVDYALPAPPEHSYNRRGNFVPRPMLEALEYAVRLGMTPAQVIVAATKHGAMACGALADYGTLSVGKYADLLILDADPLADITHVRRLALVMKEGRVIDRSRLPSRPVYDMEGQDSVREHYWYRLEKDTFTALGSIFGGVTRSDSQETELEQLIRKHRVQRFALIYGLGPTPDTMVGRQRWLQLFAQQLGEYRPQLRPDQRAAFDAGVRAWAAQWAKEGQP